MKLKLPSKPAEVENRLADPEEMGTLRQFLSLAALHIPGEKMLTTLQLGSQCFSYDL